MPNRILDDEPIDRTGLYKPYYGILITSLIAFLFYRLGDQTWQDQLSALIIAISFSTGTIVVGIFTEDWYWRIVGLLVALGGTALTYWFIFGATTNHLEVNTLAVRSILRASLCVGGTLLFIGIVDWAIKRKAGEGKESIFGALDPRNHYRQLPQRKQQ